MTKQILLGTAAALLIAGQASALTMTLLEDDRSISARADVGQFGDDNKEAPVPAFSSFSSDVGANASDIPNLTTGDALNGFYGTSANASAAQKSSFGPLSINGEGGANAYGSHGGFELVSALGDAEVPFGSFDAQASSVLDVLFSIDERATFDIEGFIRSGIGQAQGAPGNLVQGVALLEFTNESTNTSIIDIEINGDDVRKIRESGVLDAGTYRIVIEAYARVRGEGVNELPLGDADTEDGYQGSANWSGDLRLSPLDQPIPEPVTTSLIGMGLGALVLRTSRRRRA